MWERFLSSRWCIPVAALIGMLLVLPTVTMGLMGDDYLHWSLLTGRDVLAQPGSPFGLFTFANGDAQINQTLRDSGKLVWWAADNLRISFWRPLAEWSQYLDYQLWPHSPALMHAHNLLLYGLMILLLGRLFSQLSPQPRQAHLATLLFAGNMLHVFAVAWIASRNQMLAGILLVLTLLAYHRWRQQGPALFGWLAAACLAMGLLSAEAGVQIAGYLVAYAVFMEPATTRWRQRLIALLPFLLLVLAWKAMHSHLGYGSVGSPGYVDPSANPVRFLGVLILRLPVLMAAQWWGASSMMFEQLDHTTQQIYAAVAALALLGLLGLIHHLGVLRHALARFYLAGALLSLVPACAGYPFDRLTINADVGVSGLLAMTLQAFWAQRRAWTGWSMAWLKAPLYVLAAVHVVVFPIGKLASAWAMAPLNRAGEDLTALALPDAPTGLTQHYLLLNAPSGEAVYYFPLTRQYHGRSNPTSMLALGPNNQAMVLSRVDEHALRLDVPTGFRSTIARDMTLQPFHAGDEARIGDIRVQVERVTAAGLPQTVRYTFPQKLDTPTWRLFAWGQDGVQAVPMPAVGQSVNLAMYDISQVMQQHFKKDR